MKFKAECIATAFAGVLSFPLSLNAQTPPPNPKVEAKANANATAKPGKKAEAKPVEPAPVKVEVKPLPHCSSYSATPLDSSLLEFDKKLYFTTPKLPTDKGGATAYLMEADLEAGKVKRVAGFKAGRSVSLFPHGTTADVITMLDFSNGKPDCGEGETSGTALHTSEQKVTSSFPLGNYLLVAGDKGFHLADANKGLLQEKDLASGQNRTLESFARGTRPIYLKAAPPIVLYTYFPEKNTLGRFIANKKVATDELKLKAGSRIVRDGDKFAIALEKSGGLQMGYFKGWSGEENRVVDLQLPPGYVPATLSVRGRFESDELLVFGKDEALRRSLKNVLHFTGKDLKTYKAPDEKTYFSSANFLNDGSSVLLLSAVDTGVVQEIWIMTSGGEPRKIDVLKAKKASPSQKKK